MKKGYTLVEVLAVLVLLSIIFSIVVINTVKYAQERKESDFENIKKIIVENAKSLVSTDSVISMQVNDKFLEEENDENHQGEVSCKLYYSVLVEKKLMDRDTKNPLTNQILDSNSYVKITLNESRNNYNFEYIYENYDSNIENCLE